MNKARLVALAAITALLTACGGGGQTVPATPGATTSAQDRQLTTLSTFVARDEATGTLVHIYPTRDIMTAIRGSERGTLAGSDLIYHGGNAGPGAIGVG